MKYTIVIKDINKSVVLPNETIAKQVFEDSKKHFKNVQLITE